MGTIAVGVDGSGGSREALHFALRQAKYEGARVRAVTTWQVPAIVHGGLGFAPTVDPKRIYEEDAKAILEQALAEVAGEAEGVDVERVVSEGRAASALVEESRHADLLVVGSRGHGGFSGLLLGSVSQECAAHAACPVVIVREKQQE